MKFFMFGKYSASGMKRISAERTDQCRTLIEELGGRVHEMYALLGEYDLVFIVELANMTDAINAAVTLGRATDISFCTAAAVPVEEFDKLVGDA